MVYTDIKAFFMKPIVAPIFCLVFALFVVMQVSLGIKNYLTVTTQPLTKPGIKLKEGATPDEKNVGLNAPLFGDYVPNNLSEGDVKRSILNVTVVGIMLASQESLSQVIIRSANGREQSFRVGDALSSGVVIKRITSDGVLVNRNGELESLTFPKNDLIFEAPPKPIIH